MRPDAELPETPRDIVKLPLKEWLLYEGAIRLARLTGMWRYPVRASGDFETMRRFDKIYWVYKALYPVQRAAKSSGLERFFKEHATHRWTLPDGFSVSQTLTLAATGDLMQHAYLARSADVLYEGIADMLFGADVSIGNLECVVFPAGAGAFELRLTEAPPLCYRIADFDAARGHHGRNYTVLSVANNHSLDCGEAGVQSTVAALDRAGIAHHGVNMTDAATRQALVVKKGGFRIGITAHTFGLNGKRPPRHRPSIVNRTNLNDRADRVDFSAIDAQIADCRHHSCDVVVALLHWGMEHEYYPRPDQLEVAHRLAELGADVIVGHHPHVVQPFECYRTQRDPDRVVPIFYSLGNLITPFSAPAFRRSGLAHVVLTRGTTRDGARRTYVADAGVNLVFQEMDFSNRLRLIPVGRA